MQPYGLDRVARVDTRRTANVAAPPGHHVPSALRPRHIIPAHRGSQAARGCLCIQISTFGPVPAQQLAAVNRRSQSMLCVSRIQIASTFVIGRLILAAVTLRIRQSIM